MTNAYRRVTVTLPVSLADAADRLAQSLDRSRSWVIAEAIRRLATEDGAVPDAQDGSRLAQLPEDLARSPEERVVAGERMAAAVAGHAHDDRDQLLSFQRYQGYLRWHTASEGRT